MTGDECFYLPALQSQVMVPVVVELLFMSMMMYLLLLNCCDDGGVFLWRVYIFGKYHYFRQNFNVVRTGNRYII